MYSNLQNLIMFKVIIFIVFVSIFYSLFDLVILMAFYIFFFLSHSFNNLNYKMIHLQNYEY